MPECLPLHIIRLRPTAGERKKLVPVRRSTRLAADDFLEFPAEARRDLRTLVQPRSAWSRTPKQKHGSRHGDWPAAPIWTTSRWAIGTEALENRKKARRQILRASQKYNKFGHVIPNVMSETPVRTA